MNNVYNVGTITSNSDKTGHNGGFIGHIGVTFNGKITNSYNAGRVSGGNSSSDVGAICGYTRTDEGLNNIVTNCYWLDTSATRACGRDGEGNTTKVTDVELKATNMPGKLNAAQDPAPWFRKDDVNNGWPILRMGIAVPEMTVTPESLSIVYGSTGTITYTYNGDGAITAVSSAVGVCTVTVDINSKTVTVSTVAVGSSVVTISAAETDSYEAISKTVAVNVTRKPIAVPTAITGLVYNGYEQTGVNAGTEYTITGNTATNAGSYIAYATPAGNYMWTDTTITAKGIGWSIGRLGIARPVAIDRTYNRGWQEGVAGGVGYYLSGNPTAIDQGIYGVTATLDPNYQWADGSVEALSLIWTMYRKDISNDDVIKSIGTEYKTYNGGEQTQAITLSHAGAILVYSTEYTVAYTDNVNAGTATITVTGIGNYTGTVTSQFIIGRLGIARPVAIDRTYNRGWQEGVAGGIGYYLSGSYTALDQGVYTATATLDSNYQWADGSVEALSLTWTMYRKDISNDDVIKSIGTETRTYNGTAHTQDISLSHAGAVLVNPTEYTVTYTDNVNAGIVTITITGQGNYTGTVTRTFIINRATQTITLANKTVNYNPNNVPVPIGNAVVTGVNGTILQVPVTYTYYTNSECTTQTTTSDGATGNGQPPAYVGVYYVVVSVAQSTNYYAASKTVTLTINKIDNTLVVAGVQNLRYIEAPQTLVTVSTPQGDVYFLIGSTPLNSSNYLSSGSTALPQGTEAGTYIVQYYTPGNRNYKEKAGSVTVIIVQSYYKDNASPRSNYYLTLSEAFNSAVSGSILTTIRDAQENIDASVVANKKLTLNLNGKTITETRGGNTYKAISNAGELIITGTGKITTGNNNTHVLGLLTSTGKLTIEKDVTIEPTKSGANTYFGLILGGNNYEANILGKIIATGTSTDAGSINVINVQGLGTLNIKGGEVSVKISSQSEEVSNTAIRIACESSDMSGAINITDDSKVISESGTAMASYALNKNKLTYNINITNSTVRGSKYGIGGGWDDNMTITVGEGATVSGGDAININGNTILKVAGGTVDAESTGIAMGSREGSNGKIEITSGTVTGRGFCGVFVWGPSKNIVVGTKGGDVSQTAPVIVGKTYGVNVDGGFEFYDGILKGQVDAFRGNVTPETNYIIHYGKEIIDGVQYRTATLIKDTIEIPTSGKPVITEWKIPATLDGNGLTTTIKIPIPANVKAYKVDWGDSVVEFVDANVGFKEHLYKNTAEQTYTIKASGYIDTFGYYSEAVPTKDNVYKDYYDFTQYVTAIRDWGVIEAKRYGFSNCTKLNSTIPSLKKVSFKNITDISLLFNNCSGLDIELQKDLFSDCTHLQYFNSTFNGCSKIKGTLPRELFASNTDVRKIARIFKGCSSLVGADISIDSNNITTMDEMFSGCTNIKTIVFEEKFKDLVGMKMFEGCNNLKSIVTLYEYSN